VRRLVRIYIEGGGEGGSTNADFRRGWKSFLKELHELAMEHNFHGLEVIRGKSRSDVYNRFCSHKTEFPDDLCFLLVDSEGPVSVHQNPWNYVRQRPGDNWAKPNWATDEHLYFMVPFVEAWLLTDLEAMAEFFKRDFNRSVLPTTDLENRTKSLIENALKRATKDTATGPYKHIHSHLIIEKTRPTMVKRLSHGNRLFTAIADVISKS
jgi:Domain of unknown function (DUF4276)